MEIKTAERRSVQLDVLGSFWDSFQSKPYHITQIILENNFIIEDENYYTVYFTSLGYSAKDGRRSFHKMKLKKDEYGKFKFIDHHYAIIGDRIRDMIYIKKSKKFILFMELDGSIAKVSLLN